MFIPLKDENPTRRKPILTALIIIINAAVFFYSMMKGVREFQAFTFQFGLIPREITHFSEFTPSHPAPLFLTPFTSMFMHGGFMHLAGNMLFLWIFGNNIEDYVGHLKFILFYIASGLAAAALFIAFSPNSEIPMVGASGAIAGIMGAYFVLYPRARILTLIFLFYFVRLVKVPASLVLGFWIIYQIAMSALSSGSGGGVAWLAHVGGFIFGWIIFRIFAAKDRGQKIYRMEWT
jgi:membrane associated rhomboid family serine protease